MRLLYLLHADPSVAPLYRAALGPDVDVVAVIAPPLAGVPGGGMSSRYDALVQQCLGRERKALLGLAKRYPPPRPLASYAEVWLATWSAGYAFPRGMSVHDRDELAGLVLLDSGHTDKDPDGTARDAGVAWAVEWALLARDGRKAFAIGHTDVPTVGTVASTTQFAAEVVRLSGGTGGRFHVEAFNVEKDPQAEHRAALNKWGPAFVAKAMGAAPPAPARPAGILEPLKVRALAWALSHVGHAEQPLGSNTSPLIKQWLAGCERDGKRLGLTAADWCVAFGCAAQAAALLPGEAPEHPYVASGIELETWARAAGCWVDAAAVRAGTAPPPEPGDWCILKRGAEAWQRHGCRVKTFPGGTAFDTVGGNEGQAVRVTSRDLRAPELRGFVRLRGRVEALDVEDTDPAPPWVPEGARDLHDDVAAGREGLEALNIGDRDVNPENVS